MDINWLSINLYWMPDDYFWSKEYSWPTLYNRYLQSAEEPIKFFQKKKK